MKDIVYDLNGNILFTRSRRQPRKLVRNRIKKQTTTKRKNRNKQHD